MNNLKNGRASIEPLWQEIAKFILPDRLRMLSTDVNDLWKSRRFIVDSTATRASRTAVSGMQAGITSPSLDWFLLAPPHPALMEQADVKRWLYGTTEAMRFVFNQSNFYQVTPMLYEDITNFGTSCAMIEGSLETAIHLTHFPIGSYWIASDWKGRTNTFAREFQMTVFDIIEKFALRDEYESSDSIDWSKVSEKVKSCYENDQYHEMVDVTHMVYPNPNYVMGDDRSEKKKFASCYFENSIQADSAKPPYEDKFLRESGYDYFPVLAPKWSVLGEDWYGNNCPGITALPDVRMLQKMQSRKLQGIEKMADPPMTGPSKLRTMPSSTMPGRKTYIDVFQGQQGFAPSYMVDPRLLEIRQDISETKQMISDIYLENVFLSLTRDQRAQPPTAREVEELSREKSSLIGPLLEQLNVDMLGPAVDITFYEMNKLGMVPPPPDMLQGMPLKVEYISELAQRQKFVAVGSMDRMLGFITAYASIDQMIPQKINAGAFVDMYGDRLGISPGVIRSEKEFAAVIQQIQQAQAAQAQAAQAESLSKTSKNLSQSETSDGDNLLDQLQGAA